MRHPNDLTGLEILQPSRSALDQDGNDPGDAHPIPAHGGADTDEHLERTGLRVHRSHRADEGLPDGRAAVPCKARDVRGVLRPEAEKEEQRERGGWSHGPYGTRITSPGWSRKFSCSPFAAMAAL